MEMPYDAQLMQRMLWDLGLDKYTEKDASVPEW